MNRNNIIFLIVAFSISLGVLLLLSPPAITPELRGQYMIMAVIMACGLYGGSSLIKKEKTTGDGNE